VGLGAGLDAVAKNKIMTLLRTEPRFLGSSARSIVAIPTKLWG
jgi:hypothetical protein